METKRTPPLETLVLNVARLCAQLVAAGCLPCFTAYPTLRPSALRRTEGDDSRFYVFHRSLGRLLWKTLN
jgi:hypothetical protein